MKSTIVISIIVLSILGVYSFTNKSLVSETNAKVENAYDNEGIQFHNGTFTDALLQAKKENKLIFLDIYASWCGPCKWLKSKTFSDIEVGKFYNSSFINTSYDGEVGEGIELSERYKVTGYPTLLFLNFNGEVVAETSGYHNVSQFIELGKKVIELKK